MKTIIRVTLALFISHLIIIVSVAAQQNIDSAQINKPGLLSGRENIQTETLITPDNNLVKGTTIESSRNLTVGARGMHTFRYLLNPESLSLTDCQAPPHSICYNCLYDLTIVITDDANNQHLPGKQPYIISRHNFSLSKPDTSCANAQGFDVADSLVLEAGNYTIIKRLGISEEGMNYYRTDVFLKNNTCQSFNDVLARQQQQLHSRIVNSTLPDTASAIAGYRANMLHDMMPVIGQYADTAANLSGYSIFGMQRDGRCNYQFPATAYLDAKGNRDSVKIYKNGLLFSVIPDSLNRNEFINYFKKSWLNSLLPMHPEYCLLQQYGSLRDNEQWNIDFQRTVTYADALAKGYLNPTGNAAFSPAGKFIVNQTDPLYRSSFGSEAKAAMEDSLFNYCKSNNTAIFPNISLWAMATIFVKCRDNADAASTVTGSCTFFYSKPENVFNTDSLCAGDLDAAWKNFRNGYLNAKTKWIEKKIRQNCGNPVIKDPYTRVFYSLDEVFAQNGNGKPTGNSVEQPTLAVAKTQNKLYADNCLAYVNRWWKQLAPCNYTKQDSTIIIPRLIAVCKGGSSIERPFGSSSVSPVNTGRFKSFDEVIKQYNDSVYNGQKNNLQCNTYLIDRPLPYQSSAILLNIPVVAKPKNCECSQINQLYTEYQASVSQYTSFSDYLLQKYHTNIRQGSLDTLRGLCNNTLTCKFISTSFMLPALLQCNTGDVCVDWNIIKPVYDSFALKFSGAIPARTEGRAAQKKINTVFKNYMNQRLGFNKSYIEYLDFMDTCKNYISLLMGDTSKTLFNNKIKSFQGPVLCETKESVDFSQAVSRQSVSHDSGSLPFIISTDIYNGYLDWLSNSFNEHYIQKCLGAVLLERFTVTHIRYSQD